MKKITFVSGGVCAPQGFSANGIHCGIRKNKLKKDLALITASVPCTAAGVYTKNLVKGAPILVTQKHLENHMARAVIVNSGNANTCNPNGVEIAEAMCALVEQYAGIPKDDVLIASTGVIGQELSLDPIREGMPSLVQGLGSDAEHSLAAAEAIMTTDTVKKECAVTFEAGGKTCTLGAICKGVGMICPNMATMLMFLTTDVAISHEMLQKAISSDVVDSLNMLSVDRDTSTNDTLVILASGKAGNEPITADNEDYRAFTKALHVVTTTLCRMLAKDGEGATKLIECTVRGAKSKKDARILAKSVVNSNLVKAMIFGEDANAGRVMCALGYAGAKIDVNQIDVRFTSKNGSVLTCENGHGMAFDEGLAKKVLGADEIQIEVFLGDGKAKATAWGCDLTYDYVKINGDYRT